MTAPLFPQLIAGPAPASPRADAIAFGAAEGASLQRIGQGISQLGQVSTQIITAAQDAQDRNALAGAQNEIAALEQQFEGDRDFATADERFAEALGKIRDGFSTTVSRGITGAQGGAASRRFQVLEGGAITAQRDRTRLRAIQIGREEGTAAVLNFAKQASISRDEIQRELFRTLALEGVDSMEASGLKTPAAATALRLVVNKGISTSELTRLKREDPAGAILELKDPFGSFTQGMTETERQTWLTGAVDEWYSQMATRDSGIQRANRIEARERKEADRQAQISLINTTTDGTPLTMAEVDEVAEFLEPTNLEKYRLVALNGGTFATETTMDRIAAADLSRRSKRGEDIEQDANFAYFRGEITENALKTMLAASRDVRFTDARDLLDVLKVGGLAAGKPAQQARLKAGQAELAMNQWIFDHPKASREDAIAQAEKLVGAAQSVSISQDARAVLPPVNAVFEANGQTLKLPETAAAIAAAFRDGRLDDAEFDQEMALYRQIKAAQKLKSDRAEARNAANEARAVEAAKK